MLEYLIEVVIKMLNTKIPIYGIFIILAFTFGLLNIYQNAKNYFLLKEELIGFLLYIILGSLFGSKYFTFFMYYKKYNGVFNFMQMGLSSYGAVIGIFLITFLFSFQYKKSFKELIYLTLPSVPLMYSLGKIGCFISGCCYGISYKGPFSITYNYSYSAPKGVSLFPVQFFESIIFFTIYLVIKTKKISIGKTLIICGISKFILDYFRMNHLEKIITINQIISLLFIIIGFVLLFAKEKRKSKS